MSRLPMPLARPALPSFAGAAAARLRAPCGRSGDLVVDDGLDQIAELALVHCGR
jgi:hypothetical protein